MTKPTFLLRKPRLPILIDTGVALLAAKSWGACQRELANIAFADAAQGNVIDANGDAFIFSPQRMIFSPGIVRRRWTKAAIIALYNGMKRAEQPEYPATSLSNKSLETVISDIVELLSIPKLSD